MNISTAASHTVRHNTKKDMKVCLETSSLLPLIVSTPYTKRLYKRIKEENNDYYIFRDCLREAQNAKFLQLSSYVGIRASQTQSNFSLSIIRNINEHFTAQNLHHNYARGCVIFLLNILDNIQNQENYSDFCDMVYLRTDNRINKIRESLNQDILNLSNQTLEYYWWINSDISNNNLNLRVNVIKDEIANSTMNKDRDIYHFEQFYNDPSFDELWVCDAGFKKQISDLKKPEFTIDIRRKIKHFSK